MTKIVRFRCRQMLLLPVFVLFYPGVVSGHTLELIRKIPHSGYSEGLDYRDGFLWHAIPKMLMKIDPKDGTVLSRFSPPTDYSESLQWFQGKLWNLSYSDNGIYVGELSGKGELKFSKKGTTPEIHGWGLTHNGVQLIMTGDYSSKLYFVDPKTAKVVRTLQTQAKDIEDLAWDGKWIWASSFTTEKGKIFPIDPQSGKVMGLYALPDDQCPVVDGLAYDGTTLWVTGKECPSIYNVKRPTDREITSNPGTDRKKSN